jgi:hypothetical protein
MKLIWNQLLGEGTCPYLRRWCLITPLGSVRLHRWYASDDDRFMHDHPWWFVTFVLAGGYVDASPKGYERVDAPTVRFRRAHHRHTVHVAEGTTATTVLLTGPEKRRWGFWIKKANGKPKFLEHRRYFRRFGHHHCDP